LDNDFLVPIQDGKAEIFGGFRPRQNHGNGDRPRRSIGLLLLPLPLAASVTSSSSRRSFAAKRSVTLHARSKSLLSVSPVAASHKSEVIEP
jgi:hypothetical protein